MKPGDIVEVEWDDHAFHQGEYAAQGVARFRSVGYFVREDVGVFCLAMSLTEHGRPYDTLAIDKRTLVRKRRVR